MTKIDSCGSVHSRVGAKIPFKLYYSSKASGCRNETTLFRKGLVVLIRFLNTPCPFECLFFCASLFLFVQVFWLLLVYVYHFVFFNRTSLLVILNFVWCVAFFLTCCRTFWWVCCSIMLLLYCVIYRKLLVEFAFFLLVFFGRCVLFYVIFLVVG